eukprot:280205-Prymnesium_polylepis.2
MPPTEGSPSSVETRSASAVAARRRGCATRMATGVLRTAASSRRSCGSCVDLPQPVAPRRMSSASRCWYAGSDERQACSACRAGSSSDSVTCCGMGVAALPLAPGAASRADLRVVCSDRRKSVVVGCGGGCGLRCNAYSQAGGGRRGAGESGQAQSGPACTPLAGLEPASHSGRMIASAVGALRGWHRATTY